MATGSAEAAEQSPRDRAAWEALDPEIRERLGFLAGHFTISARQAESDAHDWERFDKTLQQAERFECH